MEFDENNSGDIGELSKGTVHTIIHSLYFQLCENCYKYVWGPYYLL